MTRPSNPDPRILRFPGSIKPAPQPKAVAPDLANLSEDQRKAMSIIVSGMPFVLIGIQSTDSGADFFTALHGADADLRNAHAHLSGVIDRAYDRKGL